MKSITATRHLFDAILTNSLDEVRVGLEDGADPNLNLTMISSYHQFKSSGKSESLDKVLLWKKNVGVAPTPVHVAVINIYHRFLREKGLDKALAILEIVLQHGGDVSRSTDNLFLWDIEGKERSVVNHLTNSLDLALVLKKTLSKTQTYEHADVMDQALSLMREYEHFGSKSSSKILTTKVAQSLLDTMKSLLFSETLSDITFLCPDGARLPAHKCVLAAASDYFRAAFTGSWAENDPSTGEWKTENSSDMMKSVLTFIYTGNHENSLLFLEVDPGAMFSIASEYGIEPLVSLAESSCIRRLSTSNLKGILQLAHQVGSSTLKLACVDFVQQRGAAILAEPDFLNLAFEDANLWNELISAITSSSTVRSAKRQRIS
jgi:hypothetical protein